VEFGFREGGRGILARSCLSPDGRRHAPAWMRAGVVLSFDYTYQDNEECDRVPFPVNLTDSIA